jgi:aspartate racemase
MKTIGLIGGMSWESTVSYYRIINQEVGRRLGGLHSAKLVVFSVDFAQIETMQRDADWPAAGVVLADAARSLAKAGAELLVLGTNTMHIVSETIEQAVDIPFLHIADCTANRLHSAGQRRVGLLGTRFTMEQPFYRERLATRHGIEVIVPEEDDRDVIHRVIYEELCRGELRQDSREHFRKIMARLVEQGAEAVILGCTEIALLVGPDDATVPLVDTARVHAESAVDFALTTA